VSPVPCAVSPISSAVEFPDASGDGTGGSTDEVFELESLDSTGGGLIVPEPSTPINTVNEKDT